MEPQNPTVPTPPQPVAPPVPATLSKNNNFLAILLSVFLAITLLIGGYLFLQVQGLTKQLAQLQVQPTATPLSTEIPSPTTDPTANWKTYTNTTHGFSFKYPSDWILNSEGDGDQYNANLNLKKDNNVIGVIANMDGIGGGPRNVPFEEINLWGKTYYKQYGDINFSAGTKTVDICDSPHGLGVFQINSKTFMISLTYQTNTEGEKPTLSLGKEFDQILSTFKFTN